MGNSIAAAAARDQALQVAGRMAGSASSKSASGRPGGAYRLGMSCLP